MFEFVAVVVATIPTRPHHDDDDDDNHDDNDNNDNGGGGDESPQDPFVNQSTSFVRQNEKQTSQPNAISHITLFYRVESKLGSSSLCPFRVC